jgi:capsular polysaccharide transport system permease protein
MISLMHSFLVQGRVIWALILREMQTRYGRENIGFLWIIGEPILFCGGVAIVWTAIRPAHEHGLPMTAFVVTGYVPLTMWRHCVMRGLKAFDSNGSLLFHRQVTPLDIILARVVLEVVGTIIAGSIVGLGAILLDFMDPPRNIGLIYLGLGYHICFSLAFALLVASLSERSEFVEKIMSAVMYLSLPLSGAFVMVDWIPERYQWILLISPSVHNVEMIRGGEFGSGVHAIYDLYYDTWSTGLLLVVGLSLTLRSRRFIVVQ